MDKRDFKKALKHLYGPSAKRVALVEVPRMNFLMIDGEGDPNRAPAFQDAIDALYPLAYALKFMVKRELAIDYGVMPLEGLWWADDMASFDAEDKSDWKWTLMIMQPDPVTPDRVSEATAQVRAKKNPVALSGVRFESFEEGRAAQVLHLGPFSEEGPTIAGVHAFIDEQGLERRGKHHEIYLSDIRRAAPEKWKTVVRQPCT